MGKLKTTPVLIKLFGKTKALEYEKLAKELRKNHNDQKAGILAIRKIKS